MYNHRILQIPKPPAPEQKEEQTPLQKEVLALQRCPTKASSRAQFTTCKIQAQLLQMKLQPLLQTAKKTLPASCEQALYYSQAWFSAVTVESETSTKAQPMINLTEAEQRFFALNRFKAAFREHQELIQQCRNSRPSKNP